MTKILSPSLTVLKILLNKISRIFENPTVRAVSKNTGWLLADRIGRVLITLLMSVLIARHLGPADFGALNYATAFVGLFLPLATFGLDRIIVRDCVRGDPSTLTVLGTTFVWRVLGGTIVMLLATAFTFVLRPTDHTTQILVAILGLAPILQAGEVIDFWFQSRMESKYVAISKTISLLFSTSLRVFLLWLDATVITFAIASLIEAIFLSTALFISYKNRGVSSGRWIPSFQYAVYLTREGWPLAANLVLHTIYLRISLLMLSSFNGDAAAGVFGAASRIYDGILPVFGLLCSSLFPPLIKLYDTNREVFFVTYARICRGLTAAGWIITILMAISSPYFIPLLFGAAFSQSGLVLSILSLGLVFQLSSLPRAAYLTIIKSQKTILAISAISAAFSAGCNYLLIPIIGVYGAAISATLATFINFFITNFFFKSTKPLAVIQIRSLFMLR